MHENENSEKDKKECKKCGIEKPSNEFYKRDDQIDGYTKLCKECYKQKCKNYYIKNRIKRIEYSKKYREKNKENELKTKKEYYYTNKDEILKKHKEYNNIEQTKEKVKNRQLKTNYGISLNEYKDLLQKQENKYSKLCVDHCHITGKFRGLLCTQCNSGLGYFKDNEEILLNAIEYLRSRR